MTNRPVEDAAHTEQQQVAPVKRIAKEVFINPTPGCHVIACPYCQSGHYKISFTIRDSWQHRIAGVVKNLGMQRFSCGHSAKVLLRP